MNLKDGKEVTSRNFENKKITGLFCFDGPLFRDRNGVYCSLTLTNDMFNRFFTVVDKLYAVIRTFESDKTYQELNMNPLITAERNIEVIEVSNLLSIKGLLKGRRDFAKSIESLVERTDLIFARMPSATSDELLRVAIKKNKAYLVEVGGCAWDAFWNHGLTGKILAPYMYLMERRGVKNAKFALYVTKDFLQKRYPNYRKTCACSDVFILDEKEEILASRIDRIRTKKTDVLKIGQTVNSIDVKYKGEDQVIRAIRVLESKGVDAEFYVAGPGTGNYIKRVAQKYGVSNKIHLVGTLNSEEIRDFCMSLDIYIQMSKQEGLPRSVIEAMSVGCPVIASNIAGIPELLSDDCMEKPGNVEGIADAIIRISDESKMIAESQKNYKCAKEYLPKFTDERRKEFFKTYLEYIIER